MENHNRHTDHWENMLPTEREFEKNNSVGCGSIFWILIVIGIIITILRFIGDALYH